MYALLLEAAGTKLPQQMKLLYRLLLQTDPVPFKAATKCVGRVWAGVRSNCSYCCYACNEFCRYSFS